MVDRKLNNTVVKAQFTTYCLKEDAINLIINYAIIRYAAFTGTLDIHDLNGFHF